LRHKSLLSSALLLGTLARAAASQPAPLGEVELDWVAPPECPTGAQVLEDARGLVTSDHQANPAERLTVRAVVELLADNRWRLSLTVGASKRRVEAASCAELGRAAALFLALLVDPLRREMPAAPPPSEPPPEPAASSRPPPPVPSARTEPRSPPEPALVRLALGAGGGLDYGTLPAPVLLGTVGASVGLGAWEFDVRGSLGGKHTRRLGPGTGANLVPTIVELEGCYAVPFGTSVRLGPCLGGEVGVMHGRAFGVANPRSGYWPWIGVDASLAFTFSFGRHVELRAAAGGSLPLYRPAFRLGDQAVSEPGIALRLGALGLYRF
jgi:hypothetical protein